MSGLPIIDMSALFDPASMSRRTPPRQNGPSRSAERSSLAENPEEMARLDEEGSNELLRTLNDWAACLEDTSLGKPSQGPPAPSP